MKWGLSGIKYVIAPITLGTFIPMSAEMKCLLMRQTNILYISHIQMNRSQAKKKIRVSRRSQQPTHISSCVALQAVSRLAKLGRQLGLPRLRLMDRDTIPCTPAPAGSSSRRATTSSLACV